VTPAANIVITIAIAYYFPYNKYLLSFNCSIDTLSSIFRCFPDAKAAQSWIKHVFGDVLKQRSAQFLQAENNQSGEDNVMASPASIFKHPFHPMLIVFPLGLFVYSLVLDFISYIGGGVTDLQMVSYYLIAGGVIGGLLAAIPGFIDFLTLKHRPKTLAAIHLIINLIVVALFAINFILRKNGTPVVPGPFILSIVGVIAVAVSGWLGGELVYVYGISVEIPPKQ
jgi:uncharacterized membrane protein